MKPTPGKVWTYRRQSKEFMIKVPQAMSQLYAYDKLQQYEFKQ